MAPDFRMAAARLSITEQQLVSALGIPPVGGGALTKQCV
jgi:hypothetical protein